MRSTPARSQRRPEVVTPLAQAGRRAAPLHRLAECDVLHQRDLRETAERVAAHEDRLVAGGDAGQARAQVHAKGDHRQQRRAALDASRRIVPTDCSANALKNQLLGVRRQARIGMQEQQAHRPSRRAAPAFICRARPRGAAITRSASGAASLAVPSSLPPSATITSWPRARSGASAGSAAPMPAASFSAGTMIESFSRASRRGTSPTSAQQALRRVRLLPDAGGVLVGFGERRIDVDRAEDLVQADAVLHRGDELGDQVAGVLADDGRAEDPVLARHGEHLDHAVRLARRRSRGPGRRCRRS